MVIPPDRLYLRDGCCNRGFVATLCSDIGTMKNLNELQIFALVAQEMSFTRAATALEVSKAAVSRAIAKVRAFVKFIQFVIPL